MTKQEFKVAFKLITGKDFGYNTEVTCEDGIILKTYEFLNTRVKVDFMEGGLFEFKNVYSRFIKEISYDRVLNMMKK